jgi:hypothetical protein
VSPRTGNASFEIFDATFGYAGGRSDARTRGRPAAAYRDSRSLA